MSKIMEHSSIKIFLKISRFLLRQLRTDRRTDGQREREIKRERERAKFGDSLNEKDVRMFDSIHSLHSLRFARSASLPSASLLSAPLCSLPLCFVPLCFSLSLSLCLSVLPQKTHDMQMISIISELMIEYQFLWIPFDHAFEEILH